MGDVGITLRQMKQQGRNSTPLSDNRVKQIFNSRDSFKAGFEVGARRQKESGNQILLDILCRLNEIPGVGLKTAAKIDKWVKEQSYNIQ